MGNIIEKIEQDLKDDKKVLFSGTPCQVAAVTTCIKDKYKDNLYTCDLVCHGVPSELVFRNFLKYIEEKNNKHIKEFIFRDKRFGWDSHYETSIFDDDTKETTYYFRNLFLRNNILRPSCYKCNYSSLNRTSDVTIADFWGVDEVLPEMYDKTGISLALINTEKGKELFNEIKNDLMYKESRIDDAIKKNPNVYKPSSMPKTREEFWRDYFRENFEYIIDKYAK